MTEAVPVSPDLPDHREQPFLYSWNRRVRHLHGISLRNLNISPPVSRARGRTITDDEYNLNTPAKLLASSERNALHPSRSFSDLPKTNASQNQSNVKGKTAQVEKPTAQPKRPKPGQMRRRSTLHWAGASPMLRQQKLEDVAVDRVVDTWFSIHHPTMKEPIYISEVMEGAMNPSFSYFDLDTVTATVTRSDTFELKIWAKNVHTEGYRLLIDLKVNLRSLQYIGKSLENFHHPLPRNCVIFHLSDGIYTSFTDLSAENVHEPHVKDSQRSIPPSNTSTYDALMKLANLDDCIQDALQTRENLEAEINNLLAKNKQGVYSAASVDTQREQVKTAGLALESERSDVQRLVLSKTDHERSIDMRKQAMVDAVKAKQDASSLPTAYDQSIQNVRSDLEKCSETSRGQVRRICEDLLTIFPIEPIKNRALHFTIRGIYLPNSVFDDTNRDEIAAALGFTAQVVYQVSMYLSIPLPYELEPNASSSYITDNISVSLAQRKYPLHPTNVNYKFEYGVFLLNKDIEFLMSQVGLRTLDIRHTLPNLKYLLYVLTAGTGELPARKVGGVKGLLTGVGSPNLSRQSSDDSVHIKQGTSEYINGNMASVRTKPLEKGINTQDAPVVTGRVRGLPYRHSLLREAG